MFSHIHIDKDPRTPNRKKNCRS